MPPDRMLASAGAMAFAPRGESVATTILATSWTMAVERKAAQLIETMNRMAASKLGGGRRPQSPRPIAGMITPATSAIGSARGITRAAIQAKARAYQ